MHDTNDKPGRILQIGGSGFLGGEVRRRLRESHSLVATYATSRPGSGNDWVRFRFGQDDPAQLLSGVAPDMVLLTGRLTGDRDLGVDAFAKAFQGLAVRLGNAHVIYVSSDAVFSGKEGRYLEHDVTDAVTLYGRKHQAAERIVASMPGPWTIVRVSFIYGASLGRLDKRTTTLKAAIEAGRPVEAQERVFKSPVDVQRAADHICAIARQAVTGVIHIPGERQSVYGFFRQRLRDEGMSHQLDRIRAVRSQQSDTSLATASLIGTGKT